MVEINRKALQIFQFLWPMIFFVFLSHQRGASWSSRRKPGLAWQQFIWWEKQLNAFQKLLTCAIITEQSLPWWWTGNYSICCYSTYHCKIFPGPVGLNTRGTPHLFVVVISPPIRYHLNRCDKFNVWYVYLIIGQISFWWQTRRKFILN